MNLKKAVLSVLVYHEIFDYPLKEEEILRYLEAKTTTTYLDKTLKKLLKNKLISKSGDYFYLREKNSITKRIKRQKHSENKTKFIKLYVYLLGLIPTVEFIGLTGAMAVSNSQKNDDIDLLVISTPNSVWSTRFMANLILFFFKRKPQKGKQNNKACLNIFIDKMDLEIKSRNLYTAHELAQMKILLNRNKTYEALMKNNKWVSKYLPNWRSAKSSNNKAKTVSMPKQVEEFLSTIQIKYMKSKRTTETIGQYQLFFHPLDHKGKILKLHTLKLERLTSNKSL